MSLTISLFIIAIVVLNIGGCFWLLIKTKNLRTDEDASGKVNHSYDGIEEYNNGSAAPRRCISVRKFGCSIRLSKPATAIPMLHGTGPLSVPTAKVDPQLWNWCYLLEIRHF